MLKQNIISLPSFLRRVMKAYAIKAHIRACGGDLHRIGRSRNWQLKIDRLNIFEVIDIIESSNEPSWLWLAKSLRQQSDDFSDEEIRDIAKRNIGVTVNELVAKTECTIAQARKIIDQLEDLDDELI